MNLSEKDPILHAVKSSVNSAATMYWRNATKMNNTPAAKNSVRQKKDAVVSVRMPKGLVQELRDLQKINHFMDISDEIRFVIRKYCLPKNLTQERSQKSLEEKQKLITDLDKILRELKTDASSYEERLHELKNMDTKSGDTNHRDNAQ